MLSLRLGSTGSVAMINYLFCLENHILGWTPWDWPSSIRGDRTRRGWERPPTLENFTKNWVVRLLGIVALSTGTERRQIPLEYLQKQRCRFTEYKQDDTWTILSSWVVLLAMSVKISGWTKKSAYISSRERLSNIKVGSTIFVRSMPMRTYIWDKIYFLLG